MKKKATEDKIKREDYRKLQLIAADIHNLIYYHACGVFFFFKLTKHYYAYFSNLKQNLCKSLS